MVFIQDQDINSFVSVITARLLKKIDSVSYLIVWNIVYW